MVEYVIDLDSAADLDIYADFPEVIYHFNDNDRPIKILKTYEWAGYSIGETVEHEGGAFVIEYFGTLDCNLSEHWPNARLDEPVIIVNTCGFAILSEINKLND